MKKILLLGTYPIRNHLHGGQLRSKAIFELYKKFADVRYCAIFNPGPYPKYGKHDIAVTGKTLARIRSNPYVEDIICGQAIWNDEIISRKLRKLLQQFKPDMIQLEQCYGWLGLRKLLPTIDAVSNATLIYSSQNVEHTMKFDIYQSIGIPVQERNKWVNLLFDTEKELAERSKLLVVTSSADKLYFEKFTSKDPVVAANGIHKKSASKRSISYWFKRYELDGSKRAIVFVGSRHVPNSQGFHELVADSIGFLPPGTRIYVVGGVCDLLRPKSGSKNLRDILFDKRITLLGNLTDDRLAGLISTSDLILLPITQGGGSNLKTAEAILSGKRIVATSVALRSFERFNDEERIAIADTPQAFKSAILQQLRAPSLQLSDLQSREAQSVLWTNCLAPLEHAVRELM